MGNIFVVAACTADKGRQGRFIRGVGEIFVVRPSTTKTTNIFPQKLPAIRYISVMNNAIFIDYPAMNVACTSLLCIQPISCRKTYYS